MNLAGRIILAVVLGAAALVATEWATQRATVEQEVWRVRLP